MAKGEPILETMPGLSLTEGIGMKVKTPFGALRATESGRSSRAVSVFGNARVSQERDFDAADIEELRLAAMPLRHDPERVWADLPSIELDADALASRHLIMSHRDDPVGLLYDHLRTRLLQALQERGWTRVAVAAPTSGCGATLVAANLALSLARRPSGRVALVDLDLRKPSLAELFGVSDAGALRDVLVAGQPLESHLLRVGQTLVLGLNGQAEPNSAEFLQEPSTVQALKAMQVDLAPDVVIYDLPPLLERDDTLAFLPQVDGILLVADGARSTAADIRECERLLKGNCELLGVVLNRAEDSPASRQKGR